MLNGEIDKLIHVTNCQGSMGSGVAWEIRNRVPDAYIAYKALEEGRGLALGDTSYGGDVFNLNGQQYYGTDGRRYLNYGALAQGLMEVADCWAREARPGVTLGLPYLMGCDRAGGDWAIVSEMIEHILGDFNVKVYSLNGYDARWH